MEGEVILRRLEDDMAKKPIKNTEPVEDRNALLEKTLIEAYLKEKGYELKDLRNLPAKLAAKLMREASNYASLKMEEVAARAKFIDELSDDQSSFD